MTSTIDHIDVSQTEVALTSGSPALELQLQPKDSAGDMVMVAPSALRIQSTNPAVATADESLAITPLSAGSTQITVTDTESGKSAPPINVTVLPKGTLAVYAGKTLSPGFDEGVNTSGGITNWVTDEGGDQRCQYPPGQQWGSVYLVAGKVAPQGPGRSTVDVSSYHYLALDLKGGGGGEKVNIGVKTATDPDNGNEPKYPVQDLGAQWQTVRIPLSQLTSSAYPPSRFGQLYVVCELVFESSFPAETVYFRYVRFEP